MRETSFLFRKKKSRRIHFCAFHSTQMREFIENCIAVKRRYPQSNKFLAFLESHYVGRYVDLNKTKRNRRSIISLDLHKFCSCPILIFFYSNRCRTALWKILRRDMRKWGTARDGIAKSQRYVRIYECWTWLISNDISQIF